MLGAEKTLELLLAPLQEATSAGEGSWRTIEAGLYCVRAVHRCRLAALWPKVCPSLCLRDRELWRPDARLYLLATMVACTLLLGLWRSLQDLQLMLCAHWQPGIDSQSIS